MDFQFQRICIKCRPRRWIFAQVVFCMLLYHLLFCFISDKRVRLIKQHCIDFVLLRITFLSNFLFRFLKTSKTKSFKRLCGVNFCRQNLPIHFADLRPLKKRYQFHKLGYINPNNESHTYYFRNNV